MEGADADGGPTAEINGVVGVQGSFVQSITDA
jgi:hypothetical protein